MAILDFLKNKSGAAALDAVMTKSGIVARAYEFVKEAHKGQTKNGEPYLNHCIAVAESLAGWGLDDTTIAAGLLHDVVEDTKITLEAVGKEFGEEIKTLVDGTTRIKVARYNFESAHAETLIKMFLAMAKDLRIIFIKLASRKDRMRTIGALPEREQLMLAKEAMEIYAPIAYRLGMFHLSGDLEDAAFKYLYPDEFNWLLANVKERYEEREKYLKEIKPIVEEALIEGGIKNFKIYFRAKRYASLYKKLLRYEMDLDKIHDLVAFRIVVESIKDCYAVPGIIHKLWPPLPGRIKDYIALPKSNGYQSIHTTVICDDNKNVEFQVKTYEMHERAENGVAAHWAYEQSKGSKDYVERKNIFANSDEIELINQLRSWQKESMSPDELINALKVDFFEDRIFVITPKGAVVDLPQGATPVDFAYSIHEKIGDECVGARVNGKIVPLDYKLRSEDVVEIIRQKNKKPSASWLEFVVTSNARSHIKKSAKTNGSFMIKPIESKTEFRIILEDRQGLLKRISDIISRAHINIGDINSQQQGDKFYAVKIKCDLHDKSKISKLLMKIKQTKGVKGVEYKLV